MRKVSFVVTIPLKPFPTQTCLYINIFPFGSLFGSFNGDESTVLGTQHRISMYFET